MSRSSSSVSSRMGGLVAARVVVCEKDEKENQRKRRIAPEAIVPMCPTESL